MTNSLEARAREKAHEMVEEALEASSPAELESILTEMGVWGLRQCDGDCHKTERDRLVRRVREMVEKGQMGPLAILKALEDGE